jgi:hypothetical protein
VKGLRIGSLGDPNPRPFAKSNYEYSDERLPKRNQNGRKTALASARFRIRCGEECVLQQPVIAAQAIDLVATCAALRRGCFDDRRTVRVFRGAMARPFATAAQNSTLLAGLRALGPAGSSAYPHRKAKVT